ncbi:MAG: MFS transporter [Clostridia bacterium]|nr:MFS transporter [Clostridia bacterium]
MEDTLKKKKVPMKTKIGYGVGGSCDTIPYYLFGTYFMFFLTDAVGIPAGIAGTISFIAIICQTISGPVVAYISDNSLNPKGRRRPMMIKVAIPFAIVTMFLFFPVGGSLGFKVAYYTVLAILFYTCYASFTSVWSALGAEMTKDYKERNTLRSIVAYSAFPFTLIVASGTIGMVGIFSSGGVDYALSWFFAVVVLGLIMAGCAIWCYLSTSEEPPAYTEEEIEKIRGERFSFVKLIKDYAGFFKIKIYRKMIIFTVIFCVGYIMMNNGTVYAMTSFCGMSEAQQSLFWTLNTLIALATVPIVFGIANKWDKKKAMMIFIGAYGVSSVVWFALGMVMDITFISFVLFSGVVALGSCAFYSLMYSLLYDCCDVYTLATGEQKEGGMLALNYLAQTVGSAIAALFLGWGLQLFGYTEAAAVTELAAKGVWSMVTIVPAVFVFLSMVFLAQYNLSKTEFDKVQAAIEDRKAGKEIDLEQFKHLI